MKRIYASFSIIKCSSACLRTFYKDSALNMIALIVKYDRYQCFYGIGLCVVRYYGEKRCQFPAVLLILILRWWCGTSQPAFVFSF